MVLAIKYKIEDGDRIVIIKAIPLNEQFRIATKLILKSIIRVFVSGRVDSPGVKLISKSAH